LLPKTPNLPPPRRGTPPLRVKITEPDATVYYPFRFKIGDKVRSTSSAGYSGTIVDGEFDGQLPGPYEITYEIKTNDGLFFRAKERELERLLEAETN
jgi:hypothetical protein